MPFGVHSYAWAGLVIRQLLQEFVSTIRQFPGVQTGNLFDEDRKRVKRGTTNGNNFFIHNFKTVTAVSRQAFDHDCRPHFLAGLA